jgi:hypothetical protein
MTTATAVVTAAAAEHPTPAHQGAPEAAAMTTAPAEVTATTAMHPPLAPSGAPAAAAMTTAAAVVTAAALVDPSASPSGPGADAATHVAPLGVAAVNLSQLSATSAAVESAAAQHGARTPADMTTAAAVVSAAVPGAAPAPVRPRPALMDAQDTALIAQQEQHGRQPGVTPKRKRSAPPTATRQMTLEQSLSPASRGDSPRPRRLRAPPNRYTPPPAGRGAQADADGELGDQHRNHK